MSKNGSSDGTRAIGGSEGGSGGFFVDDSGVRVSGCRRESDVECGDPSQECDCSGAGDVEVEGARR